MKNILSYLISITTACGVLCTLSCKKTTYSAPCRIVAIYDTSSANGQTSASVRLLTYNNDGKVSTVTTMYGSTSYTRVFTYINNEIHSVPSDPGYDVDTIVLNSKGQPISINSIDVGYPTSYRQKTFTYDQNGQLKTVLETSQGYQGTTTYTYANGDMASEQFDQATPLQYTYYTDKTNVEGDMSRIGDICQYGVPTTPSAHLVKTMLNDNYFSNYSYTFDSDGKILTATNTQSNLIAKETYVYDCAQ